MLATQGPGERPGTRSRPRLPLDHAGGAFVIRRVNPSGPPRSSWAAGMNPDRPRQSVADGTAQLPPKPSLPAPDVCRTVRVGGGTRTMTPRCLGTGRYKAA